ncbi:MAG: hypothetical protein R3C68_18730 [Myxococcota bacterium]
MHDANGAGLAANQIYESVRICAHSRCRTTRAIPINPISL